jgi:hypothetical protein
MKLPPYAGQFLFESLPMHALIPAGDMGCMSNIAQFYTLKFIS